MRKKVKVALMGFGTVGTGTYKILTENKELIANQVGADIEVVKILVRDMNRKRLVEAPEHLFTSNADDILENPEVDIVVELMGGLEPAFSYIMKALDRGKHVVTANKEIMAKKGREILSKADENGLSMYFEASVCGGIPIIRALKNSLAADRIKKIMGIVNGTTNYILTKMSQDGNEYEDALKEAQALGYAEANPTADVEGFDAAYKMAILSSIGFHTKVDIEKVKREGISKISRLDIEYGNELGWTIKLLGIAQDIDGKLEISVSPVMLPKSHPLATVMGVNNAVFIYSDAAGELMFYGPGAGQTATGNSVAADIMAVASQIVIGNKMRPNCTCFTDRDYVDELKTCYYTRMNVINKPGVLAKIAAVFGNFGVSIESVLQKKTEGDKAEIVWITARVGEHSFRKAIEVIESLDVVNSISSIIRVEDDRYC